MTSTVRPLKTGDLVTVPAGPGLRRRAVVESVSPDGRRFTDTAGGRHRAGDAEVVPLADAAGEVARVA